MARDWSQTGGGAATDHMNFGDVTYLDSLAAMTLAGWFWWDTTPGGGTNYSVVRKDGTLTPMQLNGTDGTWNCPIWAPNIKIHQGPTFATVGTGAWHHLAATWDNSRGSVRFYIDGALNMTSTLDTSTGTTTGTGNAFVFSGISSEAYDGKMAEVALWNRELVADEIAAMGADAYCPMFSPKGMLLYMPMVRDTVNRIGASPTVTQTDVIDHPRIIYPGRVQTFKPGAAAPATAVKDIIGAGIIAFAR